MTLLEFAINGIKRHPSFNEYSLDTADDTAIAATLLQYCPTIFVSSFVACDSFNDDTESCVSCWLQEVPEDTKFDIYHLDADGIIKYLKQALGEWLSAPVNPVGKEERDSNIEFGVVEQKKCGESNTKSMEKCAQFDAICKELMSLHAKKSADYGDSFHQTFVEEGWAAPRLRLSDKLNRIKQLTKSGAQQVKEESLRDTLLDLSSYAILTIMELDNVNNKEKEEA